VVKGTTMRQRATSVMAKDFLGMAATSSYKVFGQDLLD